MIRISFVLLAIALLPVLPAAGQIDRTSTSATPTPNELRSGLLYAPSAQVHSSRERSVPLAAVMSAVVPGAGQAYTRQWIKAAAGVAIEAALITAYVVWNGQGQDAERDFQAYAHEHWSPVQYAEWLEDYSDWLPASERFEIDIPNDIDFRNPGDWSSTERERVRAFFDQMRAAENAVYHPETGAAFSHHIPYFAEQQYYELIGKYFQFAPGWEDYGEWKDDDGNYVDAVMDPERTASDGSKPNVKGRFVEYASAHADANTLFRRASRVTAILLVNHVVAAIDAAVSAKLHNDRLTPGISVHATPDGEIVPLAALRYTF